MKSTPDEITDYIKKLKAALTQITRGKTNGWNISILDTDDKDFTIILKLYKQVEPLEE